MTSPDEMPNRSKKFIGCVVLAITIGLLCLLLTPKKSSPVYKGKTMEAWMNELKKPGSADELFEGLDATNAMAFAILTEALDVKETWFQKWRRVIWPKLPANLRRHFSKPTLIPDQTRSLALFVFGAEKRYYQPAVPKLLKIVREDEHPGCRYAAIRAVESVVGNDAHVPDQAEIKETVKVLEAASNDPDPRVKAEAAKALNIVDPWNAVARMKANNQGK